jgi:hypothetical protein
MELRETGIDVANWIRLAQERVQWRACVSAVMNLQFPKESRIYFNKLCDDQLSYNILHNGVSKK